MIVYKIYRKRYRYVAIELPELEENLGLTNVETFRSSDFINVRTYKEITLDKHK